MTPREILEHPQPRQLPDLSRPVALVLVAVLHLFPDAGAPGRLVAGIRDALPRAAAW